MKIPKNEIVLQQERKDCGIACLSSVIKHFGGEQSLERIREFSGCDDRGATLLGLYQAANEFGLKAEAYAIDFDKLKSLNTPLILHVSLKNGWDHYMVFYGYDNGLYFFMDPAEGAIEMDENSLAEIWRTGSILTFEVSALFKTIEKKNQEKWIFFLSLV